MNSSRDTATKQTIFLYFLLYKFLLLSVSNFILLFIQKLGSSGQRNATRCGLWWVEMLKVMGQYKEAANVYFRISGEVITLSLFSFSFIFSRKRVKV